MSTFEEKVEELREHLDDPAMAVHEHEGFTFGERVRVLEDTEDGLCEGDEGVIIIEGVGSAAHGSARTGLFVVVEGMTSPMEAQADQLEAVI